MNGQKPLELILARNLLSSLSTPAFLVGDEGALLFYNEAAGAMLGRRLRGDRNDAAPRSWTTEFGPFGDDDVADSPTTRSPPRVAVRENRPYHGKLPNQRRPAASITTSPRARSRSSDWEEPVAVRS